jgi:hypothetical protein
MTPDGLVALMVNGPGFEDRFGRARDLFDCPTAFLFIETDDITAFLDPDLLDLEW